MIKGEWWEGWKLLICKEVTVPNFINGIYKSLLNFITKIGIKGVKPESEH